MRFINFERTKLPEEILKHNLEEKKKYFADISIEFEKSDAEVQVNVTYTNSPPHQTKNLKRKKLSLHLLLLCEF